MLKGGEYLTCDDNEILSLNKLIIDNTIWGELAKVYNSKIAKEKTITVGNTFNTNVMNVIIYLNGYRRLMVDYYINKGINIILPQYIHRYTKYLDGKEFSDVLKTTAFGSDSPISDYDITIEGPGNYIIMMKIIRDFINNTKKTTAMVLDTNVYIAPVIRFNKNTNYKFLMDNIPQLKILRISNEENDLFSGVIIPNNEIIFRIEWKNITEKLNLGHLDLDDKIIYQKYNELYQVGEYIDKIVYQMDVSLFEKRTLEKRELLLFNLIIYACKTSIESYHALSTILVVVYGIQGGYDLSLLQKQNYINSAYENLVELIIHWNNNKSKDNTVKLKLVKYIYRLLFSLDKANIKNYSEYLPVVKYLNDNKTLSNIYETEQFNILSNNILNDKKNILEFEMFINIFNIIKQNKP